MKRLLLACLLGTAGISQAQTAWNANVFQNTLLGKSDISTPHVIPLTLMIGDGAGGVLLLHNRVAADSSVSTHFSRWNAAGMYANTALDIPNACLITAITDRNTGAYFSFERNGMAWIGRVDNTSDTAFMNFNVPYSGSLAQPIDFQQRFKNLVEDGSGKTVLSYVEQDPLHAQDYFNQMAKVDLGGAMPWTSATLKADSGSFNAEYGHPHAVYTGDGGIISVYSNYNLQGESANAGSFAINRSNVNGTRMWNPLRRLIFPSNTYSNVSEPYLTRDELGGTWISFMADSSGTSLVYLQRLVNNGSWFFDGLGRKLDMANAYQVVPDRSRGLIFTLQRNNGSGLENRLYHMDVQGNLVDSQVNMQLDQEIVALYASSTALYVMSLDAVRALSLSKYTHSGQRLYGPVSVCGIGSTAKSSFNLAPDNDSGMYVSWTEDRGGWASYAMHLDASGHTSGTNSGLQGQDFNSLHLYPQPASGKVNIQATSGISTVSLYDMQGRLCGHEVYPHPAPEAAFSLNVPKGLYLLHVETEQGIQVSRLLAD